MSISGHWEGFYVQNPGCEMRTLADAPEDERFPIEAWFEQEGASCSGKMLDHRPRSTYPLSEAIQAYGFIARRRWSRFMQQFPDATYSTELASESAIVGSVAGQQISFTKKYLRNSKYVLAFGGHRQENELPGLVFYTGVLSEDGNCIEGYYRTSLKHLSRESRIRQPFRLLRQAP